MRPSDGIEPRTLHVEVTDLAEHFRLSLDPVGNTVERIEGPADLRVSGTASDLYTFLWNRPAGPSITTEGDPGVMEVWRETCRVQWL